MWEGIRKYIILCVALLVFAAMLTAGAASMEKTAQQKVKKPAMSLMPSIDIKVPQYMAPEIGGISDSYVIARNRHTGEIQRFYGAYYYYGWDDDWEIIARGKGMVPQVPGIGWKPLLRK